MSLGLARVLIRTGSSFGTVTIPGFAPEAAESLKLEIMHRLAVREAEQ
jgi:membrane protein YdbS with pleckstrin-like domain